MRRSPSDPRPVGLGFVVPAGVNMSTIDPVVDFGTTPWERSIAMPAIHAAYGYPFKEGQPCVLLPEVAAVVAPIPDAPDGATSLLGAFMTQAEQHARAVRYAVEVRALALNLRTRGVRECRAPVSPPSPSSSSPWGRVALGSVLVVVGAVGAVWARRRRNPRRRRFSPWGRS